MCEVCVYCFWMYLLVLCSICNICSISSSVWCTWYTLFLQRITSLSPVEYKPPRICSRSSTGRTHTTRTTHYIPAPTNQPPLTCLLDSSPCVCEAVHCGKAQRECPGNAGKDSILTRSITVCSPLLPHLLLLQRHLVFRICIHLT